MGAEQCPGEEKQQTGWTSSYPWVVDWLGSQVGVGTRVLKQLQEIVFKNTPWKYKDIYYRASPEIFKLRHCDATAREPLALKGWKGEKAAT